MTSPFWLPVSWPAGRAARSPRWRALGSSWEDDWAVRVGDDWAISRTFFGDFTNQLWRNGGFPLENHLELRFPKWATPHHPSHGWPFFCIESTIVTWFPRTPQLNSVNGPFWLAMPKLEHPWVHHCDPAAPDSQVPLGSELQRHFYWSRGPGGVILWWPDCQQQMWHHSGCLGCGIHHPSRWGWSIATDLDDMLKQLHILSHTLDTLLMLFAVGTSRLDHRIFTR